MRGNIPGTLKHSCHSYYSLHELLSHCQPYYFRNLLRARWWHDIFFSVWCLRTPPLRPKPHAQSISRTYVFFFLFVHARPVLCNLAINSIILIIGDTNLQMHSNLRITTNKKLVGISIIRIN
jgi:hypothetical protein